MISNSEYIINPLFNNGKLISLRIKSKVHTLEFRDSNSLLSMPLKEFNKELNLG